MCAVCTRVGKNNPNKSMRSKRKKAEASERAVYQSDLQKRFTRSVRKSSLCEHKREMLGSTNHVRSYQKLSKTTLSNDEY